MTTEEKAKQQYFEEISKKREEVITELLKEKGITEWELIDGCDEGKTLPGGITEESGTILTKDGKIYDYWLDWDPEKIAPDGSKGYYTLGENRTFMDKGKQHRYFEEINPEDELYPKPDDSSFIAAKKRLGLK